MTQTITKQQPSTNYLFSNMRKINELSEKQDRELVELLMGGSRDAFVELYARFRERLVCFCKQYMRNEADTEDIVQDIFLKIWEIHQFLNPELSFSGFVQTMAKNLITDKFRHFDVHSRFARNILTNEIDTTNETEDAIIDNDYTELLNELIESLPPMQKKVFQLNRIEGLKYKEISELLQISVENVRKHASLASKKIEEQFKKHDIHF